MATTFWVGEQFQPNAADGSQVCSAYDSQWAFDWSGGVSVGLNNVTGCPGAALGGCDGIPGGTNPATYSCKTEPRTAANGFFPTSSLVHPAENPFYVDVPYDDNIANGNVTGRQRCAEIPWAKVVDPAGAHCTDQNYSYLKNRWVRVQGYDGQFCYAQVADAGPGKYHDTAYVFGTTDARPASTKYNNAGMDVSPAMNGCLGFTQLDGDTDTINWQFVDTADVPPGPWKTIVTTSGVKN